MIFLFYISLYIIIGVLLTRLLLLFSNKEEKKEVIRVLPMCVMMWPLVTLFMIIFKLAGGVISDDE